MAAHERLMVTKNLIDSFNFLDEVIDKTLGNDYASGSCQQRHLSPLLFGLFFFIRCCVLKKKTYIDKRTHIKWA